MLHTMLAGETEKGLRSVSLQPQISWASRRGGGGLRPLPAMKPAAKPAND